MGRWALRLSLALGIWTSLFTCSSANVNYCFAARAKSCSECLQTGVGCAYCPDETYLGPRCDTYKNILAQGCTAAAVITASSSMSIDKRESINVKLAKSQVTPQKVTMSFLPGEERLLDVEVFAPLKGPLDLYILMDFSNSMADDLDNLKKMGTELARVVGDLSDDYTIGFGKFVDKVIEPQTDMRPSKLAQPWPDSDPPFSFKNVIKLTSNKDFYNSELQKERISGNLDAPEGGFDAILQAAVCTSQIGWRPLSTHLLVFSTESAFHYESDGINVLAGILKRNDEACHLDPSGKYTHDTAQDYPSVPTLVRLLRHHNIIPIFAVTNHSYIYYQKLKEYFPIAEVGLLQEDSSNMLQLLTAAFESIRSKMSIHAEKPKAFAAAEFMKTSGEIAQYGNFDFKPGNIGKFQMRLKAKHSVDEEPVCQTGPDVREGEVKVKPTTFHEGVTIEASVICPTCDCEKSPLVGSPRCHKNGDLVCGKCKCYKDWLGTYCNCSATASALDTSQCIGPGMTEPCYGRGDCLACGQCVCHNPDQFEGPFCQFDKTQCSRFGGFLCNDRGSCSMGRCLCSDGWEGNACECPISNTTCLDANGGICNGQGKCVCGRCECPNTGLDLTSTCEADFQGLLGACEATRTCAQCQAWKTGEKKEEAECDQCPFKIVKVDKLKESKTVLDSCSFRDEEDDCTYYYTVDNSKTAVKGLEVQVLEKKECPPVSLLWLLPLLLFLLLLLALLLLCCWKYCGWCKSCCGGCLALLPCCKKGRMVGFKEDLAFRQSQVAAANHLDTPMVRTGPLKGTDVVRWKVTDNVHRNQNHSLAWLKANTRETIPFLLSLRLNRQFSEDLTYPDSKDGEQLRKDVNDSLNEVYKQIPLVQKVQKTTFRKQKNAGKRQENVIMDTVLAAPRGSYPDIVKVTEKNVQSGNFHNLRVLPGYYTVATDSEATGVVEFQEGVESLDVHVPLFVKDQDDEEKKLLVEALEVPLGIAEIGKKFVNITITKDHAPSVFSFLQDNYTYSRSEGVANIPIVREIREDRRAQVSYRSLDHTAKENKDYISVGGDLTYAPGETQKTVPVRLLELSERDGLLEDKQVRKFYMDLVNPQQGAKLGRYPRTTVTIADLPESSQVMFKSPTHSFSTSDPLYKIPVIRTQNPGNPATVRWRTKDAQRFDLTGTLKFDPKETEKNIVINPKTYPGPVRPEKFQLELYDPGNNATLGERRATTVSVTDGAPEIDQTQTMGFINQVATSPGGHAMAPGNPRVKATGPRTIRLNWDPPAGNPKGYKVKYWIYGDSEKDPTVLDVKSPQAELTDLYPYCDYEMKVCAYNALGDGYDTDMVACQTLEDAPGVPGRLAFNVISPTVTQVSWAEPAETNGNITAYEVIYTPINDDMKPMGAAKKVSIDNPKKRMLLIENLQRAQAYQYKVRAKNNVGWGPFRDATINLASQPARPMSIPIIPNIPIVDAEAGDEYDQYLMYSNEVPRTPGGSKTPSVSGEGFVKLVGSDLDLRSVSWKKHVDVIPRSRLSTDTEASSEETRPDSMLNGNFLFSGGTPNRSFSSSSSPMGTLNSSYHVGGGSYTSETKSTYMTGPGGTRRTELMGEGGLSGISSTDVTMRKRSEMRTYTEENIRDSIVMGELSNNFPDLGGFGMSGTQSSSQFSYNLTSSGAQAGSDSAEVGRALYSLDRVLQDARSPGVPDTPSRLVFSALGPTSLKVSWQEPHCDKDIQGYCVLYQLLNGGEVKRLNVTNPAENSVVVRDLLPNQSYLFKVKAQSQEGWGPEREGVITIESAVDPRSPLSPVPGSPFTLRTPSAPGPLIFTALSPDSLQLSWDKPRKPNGDILGYVGTCEQLHGGGNVRSFQVSGDSSETSLTVPNLTENVPYKFKVVAKTTQGFGPEREGIITIESQDGGALSQYNSQSMSSREVFQLPTEVTRTMINEPFFSSDGMMVSTQHTETSGMVTRHVTKEVVQRSVMGGTSVTKNMYYES